MKYISPEHKQVKRNLAWLQWVADRRPLEPYEQHWLAEESAKLKAIEAAAALRTQLGDRGTDSVAALEECRAGRMAELVDDYEFMTTQAGDLGGVEIL